jgi:phenylalanyl-tRNA synthetase alpha chain
MKPKTELLSPERLAASLAIPDLSDRKNGIHAINLIVDNITTALRAAYTRAKVCEVRRDPIVTVRENFDDLLFPSDNLGRSSRYTRYVSPTSVLRTHTSSGVPAWLKEVAREGTRDAVAVLPGICYRRDVVDARHCGEPHQMDVWRIVRGTPRMGRSELLELIETVVHAIAPKARYRVNEVVHPYTLRGLEVEILMHGNWLEVLECGEAHPTVLENAGLDPREYSGLALGMGLDRLAMVTKKIDDIRLLRSEEPRIRAQMSDLRPYVQVSRMPPIKRDLSIATDLDASIEDICDAAMVALGDDAHIIEDVEIVSSALREELPPQAIERIGMMQGQRNLLVRLTLRSHERTLTQGEANEARDRVYRAIHKGSKMVLISDQLVST